MMAVERVSVFIAHQSYASSSQCAPVALRDRRVVEIGQQGLDALIGLFASPMRQRQIRFGVVAQLGAFIEQTN